MKNTVEVEVDLSWEQVVDLVMQLSTNEKKKLVQVLQASLDNGTPGLEKS